MTKINNQTKKIKMEPPIFEDQICELIRDYLNILSNSHEYYIQFIDKSYSHGTIKVPLPESMRDIMAECFDTFKSNVELGIRACITIIDRFPLCAYVCRDNSSLNIVYLHRSRRDSDIFR